MVLTFVLTVCILRPLIPFLKSKKMGQKILEIGPRWHKNKEGTPMMGGLAFIAASVAVLFASLIFMALTSEMTTLLPAALVVGYGVLNALIGFIDDSAKLRKKQNEGLTARQKYLLQLAAAALFLILLHLTDVISTELYIPFVGVSWDLGVFYYIIALLLLTGIVNSVNLTDGIDGLSSSVTLVVGIFFTAAAFLSGNVENSNAVALIGALLIGGTLGFLVYNFYPARIFMGDTGSLFLGGMVVGCAFVAGNPLIIVICGIIYICEAASVILQVGYFKLTHGKRLFKMAPIHHHFEKCGWNEIRIVAVFSAVTAVFCAAAWFGL
ncbi:MAG: phospho-N-acetylmuramoyl-pentapeptide-transferase [Ruminococcaceae bacterium]|nr:phospho-N-acetylmuramoyl-pentapeptide-transferase [Oscillospiraceae bacterium]